MEETHKQISGFSFLPPFIQSGGFVGLTRKNASQIQRKCLLKPMTSEELLKVCYTHIKATAQSGWFYCQVPKLRPMTKKTISQVLKALRKDGFSVINRDDEIKIGW